MRKRFQLISLFAFLLLLAGMILSQTVFAATTVTVDDTGDDPDINWGDGICATSSGTCTLRAAIIELNALGADITPHQIHFNIPGDGPHLIAPNDLLPRIGVPLVIDGSTQPGAACPSAGQPADLRIVLDGSNLASLLYANGLDLMSSGSGGSHGSTIRGLVIGNFISGGITIYSDNNQIECNHIGVAANGVTPMGNGYNGINILGENNTVGGAGSEAQRNVISANDGYGIYDSGDGSTVIVNNYIGTTAAGLSPLGNENGIFLLAAEGTVGGSSPLARNVISGNDHYGIHILGTENSQVLGNFIGTGGDGVTPLPNGWDGIFIFDDTNNNTIGGTAPGEANRIAYNGDSGILLLGWNADIRHPQNNPLRGNQIFGNEDLGIDLGYDNVDENDALDEDEGPNGRQNHPTLLSAASSGHILGSLESQPNQSYDIDFYVSNTCDDSGYGEGEVYLGSTNVTTDGAGSAAIAVTLNSVSLTAGQSVSATATDAAGNTSEFSACAFVDGLNPNAPPTWISDCRGTASSTPPPPPPPAGDHFVYLPLVTSEQSATAMSHTAAATQMLTLTDGGTVTGVDGVSLGAIAGTLTTTLEISITHTSAPTPTIITDPQIHGAYYHIAADENVLLCDQAKGFVLGLPVPNGVATDSLAIAAISAGSSGWGIISGLYDPQSELLLVPLASLTETGFTAVLIERENFTSLPDQATVSPAETGQPESQRRQVNTTPEFRILCQGGMSVCSEIKDFLDLVYIEMSDMGYSDPNIPCALQELGLNPPRRECIPDSYQVEILNYDSTACEINGAPAGAYLHFLEQEWLNPFFWVCPTNTSQLFNVDKRAIRYHYFQATQYGWPEHLPVWTDWVNGDVHHQHNDWVIDSTATAAMISIPTVMESTNDYARRPVDVPLASITEDYEYRSQDFWVYLGKTLAEGLTMLEPLFEQHGATTQAVVNWAGGESNFQDLYWNWVQNQVMLEDDILLNDDDTGDPCTYQGHVETLYYNELISNDHEGLTNAPGTLEPLTTHVIELQPAGRRPIHMGVRDPKSIATPDNLRYKVYVDGEADCELMTDSESRTFSEAEWAEIVANSSRVFIVVANADPDEEQKYMVTVESVPYTP